MIPGRRVSAGGTERAKLSSEGNQLYRNSDESTSNPDEEGLSDH